MHYYQFNIGDYAASTRGLTDIEDLAYRRMIDQYYLDEQPFNGRSTDVARMVGLREHEDSVAYVLNRFFEEIDGRWVHHRIEINIAEFKLKQQKASEAGKASAKSRAKSKAYKNNPTDAEQAINDRSTDAQPTNNHKPITNNHNTSNRAKGFAPPTIDQVRDYVTDNRYPVDPERFVDFYASKGWMVGKNKMKDWKAAVRTWSKGNGQTGSGTQSNTPKQTAAQRIAARRLELAAQSPDVGVVAADDRDVWPPLDEPAGRGAQRYLGEGTS